MENNDFVIQILRKLLSCGNFSSERHLITPLPKLSMHRYSFKWPITHFDVQLKEVLLSSSALRLLDGHFRIAVKVIDRAIHQSLRNLPSDLLLVIGYMTRNSCQLTFLVIPGMHELPTDLKLPAGFRPAMVERMHTTRQLQASTLLCSSLYLHSRRHFCVCTTFS